jgi:NAD(P)-dependent dehydrogenase (short-subunit alcohol dehydrogenase family)
MGKVALVTGANQGLGFALAAGLAQRMARDDVVYLTGRDGERVAAAAAHIEGARAQVRTRVLDVRDEAAVHALAGELGAVDIVFSNAAARLTPDTAWRELIGPFVDTNNLGTTHMLRAFSRILRPGGRLLIVASAFGSLRELPEQLRSRFDTDAMTLDDIDAVMRDWRNAVLEGRAGDQGWPDWINIPSKIGQVAAVRVLARERRAADEADGTLVAAVCPGLVDTDASRPWFDDMSKAQSPRDAAESLLQLALEPDFDPRFYGELVQYAKVIPWR